MKDKDYKKIMEFVNVGGGLIPNNEPASELLEQSHRGEIMAFQEVTARDLSFHRAYMGLLKYIYDYLPASFRNKVPADKFYIFVKHLKGQYDVLFEFKDGTKLVEYQSIAFGKLSQKAFEAYVREQLPWIYENVIGAFYEGDIYSGIIDNIEDEWERFLNRL